MPLSRHSACAGDTRPAYNGFSAGATYGTTPAPAGEYARGGSSMSHQKNRREAAWKSRKQEQHPHGKIKSLKELSDEAERQ